jgi:nitroreductase
VDVFEAITMRRSVRRYADRAIPQEVLARMCQAMHAAPSACNLQPWHFILVADSQLRQEIARLAHDQAWIAGAPIIVVACGLPGQAYRYMGGEHSSVDIDVAIALDHLTLAAAAEGLGTCWIGAFPAADIQRLLGIPAAVKVVAMTPLGYPATADLQHCLRDEDRKPLVELFSMNRYEGPAA